MLEVGSKFEVCSVRLFYFLFQDFLFVFCRHFQNHNGSMVVGSFQFPYRTVCWIYRPLVYDTVYFYFITVFIAVHSTARGRRRNKKKRNNVMG